MSRKAHFRLVVGLSAFAMVVAIGTAAAAGEKSQKRVMILPRADGPAERLQAHPRVPVEVAPLSGSVSPSAAADSSPQRTDRVTAHACAGSKMSPAECGQLAARMAKFMNENGPRRSAHAPTAADLCREPKQPGSRCAAAVAQIAAWLKTRQTAEAARPPALSGSTTHDR